MAVVTIDKYEFPEEDEGLTFTSSFKKIGFSFTGIGGKITVAKLKFAKSSSFAGTLQVKIFAHTGTYGTSSLPTGDALDTSTRVLDMSEVPIATTVQMFSFPFAGDLVLEKGVHYCLLGELTSTEVNTSTRILYIIASTNLGHNGNSFAYSTASSQWALASDADVWFNVSGKPEPLSIGYKTSLPPFNRA